MYNLCNIRLNLFPGVGAPVVTGSRQSKLPELMRINLLLDCSVRMSGTQTLAEVMVIKSMNIGLNKCLKWSFKHWTIAVKAFVAKRTSKS